jgi:hypothetical protein
MNPRGPYWNDAADLLAWLAQLRDVLGDMYAAAEDITRDENDRTLGRLAAREAILAAPHHGEGDGRLRDEERRRRVRRRDAELVSARSLKGRKAGLGFAESRWPPRREAAPSPPTA